MDSIEVAVVRAVRPARRDIPSKVEIVGLFFGAAFYSGKSMRQKRLGLYTVACRRLPGDWQRPVPTTPARASPVRNTRNDMGGKFK